MIINLFKTYYPLFGVRGVFLAAWSRLHRKTMRVAIEVPGVKHPVHVRLRSSDISTLQQVLIEQGYRCALAQPPETIVDAGANIGLTAVFYANQYPNAKILAIEPVASNFIMLQLNLAAYPSITPVQGALWNQPAELGIVDPGLGAWGFQTEAWAKSGKRKQDRVRGLTLESLMQENHLNFVDLLKMDIEGSEKEVFEDSDRWIEKVGVIAIELHEEIRPGCKLAMSRATKGFEQIGHRGETLFMARPGRAQRLEPELNGRSVDARGMDRSATGCCKIVQVFPS